MVGLLCAVRLPALAPPQGHGSVCPDRVLMSESTPRTPERASPRGEGRAGALSTGSDLNGMWGAVLVAEPYRVALVGHSILSLYSSFSAYD